MRIFIELLFFLLGAVIGSFLNVCIFRMPREKSIVRPPSSCPECGKPVRFYDNIPIVSYILLRGRCRDCGAPISAKYPIVEAITALMFVFLFVRFGLSLSLAVFLIFACALIVISFIDLEFKIIPDILSVGGMVVGFLFSILRPYYRNLDPRFGMLDALYGIVLGGGVLFAIAWTYQFITKREGMGGGDIKLLAMIGAFCGIKGVAFSLMSGSVLGTVVGVPLLFVKGEGGKYAIPFGPFLSLGALIYVFTGDRIIDWIFGILGSG